MSLRKMVNDWKDELSQKIDLIEFWVNDFDGDMRECSFDEGCEICGSDLGLELHHIAGRKHDDRTVTVCSACHRILSDEQKVWDKRWDQEDQFNSVRQAFYLMGLRDILRLKSRKTGDSNYETLGRQLNEEISKLLRGEA